MNVTKTLKHQFVEFIPEQLDDGVIYVSTEYATVSHNCCCGCGSEVVTPLSPNDWELTFDGKSISLYPSIGNWNFPCQSHYWVKRNKIRWAERWSAEKIASGQARDRWTKEEYFSSADTEESRPAVTEAVEQGIQKSKTTLWQKILDWAGRR
jgi:hypothetical protein